MQGIYQKEKREKHRAWTRLIRVIPNKLPSLPMPKVIPTILTRFSDVWQTYRQMWYVPFIWSFAWCSYWIIFDSVVWNKPLAQLNLLNYVGAAASAVFILAASPIRRRLQKGVVFVRTHLGRGLHRVSVLFRNKIRKRLSHIAIRRRQESSQVEKPTLQEPQVLKSSHTGHARRVTKLSQAKPQTQQPSSPVSSTLPSFDCSSQNGVFGGMDQCLICANLIDCTYRRNKLSGSEVDNKSYAPSLSVEEIVVEEAVAS
jgi:hypothetical protein